MIHIKKCMAVSWSVLMIGIMVFVGCNVDNETRIDIDLGKTASEAELNEAVSAEEEGTYIFAFDLRSNPQEDARQYLPLLQYLERKTGLRFDLRLITEDTKIISQLGTGKIHFAAVGAGTCISVGEKYGIVPLVRGLNESGKPEYKSVIVVAAESPINKVEQLRGKRFAFGSYTSTQGHIIPRIILAKHGLTVDDFSVYKFTGSHFNCVNEVIAGRFDACGMQDTMGQEYAEKGLVRIIHTSGYYPSSGIAANKDVPTEIIEKVREVLLDFQPEGRDKEGLYHWDKTEMPNGFIRAHDEDYAELRKWCRAFGIIE